MKISTFLFSSVSFAQRIQLRNLTDSISHWDDLIDDTPTQHWSDRPTESESSEDRAIDNLQLGKTKESEEKVILSLSEEDQEKRYLSDVEKNTCFDCRGTTAIDCLQWGRKVDCYDHEVCQVVERRRGGKSYFIEAKCKQKFGACQINQQQNNKTHGIDQLTECHNQQFDLNRAEIPSTCRQCASDVRTMTQFIAEIARFDEFNGLPVEKWMENLDEK